MQVELKLPDFVPDLKSVGNRSGVQGSVRQKGNRQLDLYERSSLGYLAFVASRSRALAIRNA